jgi:hypothetical protein
MDFTVILLVFIVKERLRLHETVATNGPIQEPSVDMSERWAVMEWYCQGKQKSNSKIFRSINAYVGMFLILQESTPQVKQIFFPVTLVSILLETQHTCSGFVLLLKIINMHIHMFEIKLKHNINML